MKDNEICRRTSLERNFSDPIVSDDRTRDKLAVTTCVKWLFVVIQFELQALITHYSLDKVLIKVILWLQASLGKKVPLPSREKASLVKCKRKGNGECKVFWRIEGSDIE